jgi:hypothetical protein
VFVCSFTSCKQEKEDSLFSEDVKLLYANILIEESFLQDPWTLSVLDTFLVVGNLKGIPAIEIYNRFSKEPIQSFLTYGQGPLEILAMDKIQTVDDKLFIVDLFSRKMLQVNKKQISNDTVMLELFFSLNGYNDDIIDEIEKISYLNETFNIVSTNATEGRIGLLNKENKKLTKFHPIVDRVFPEEELDSRRHNRLFSSDMTINTKNNRVALATHMADILDIFELSNRELKPIWHYQTFLPNNISIITFENTPPQAFYTNESKYGYFDITSSDKNIYALFVGEAPGENGSLFYTNKIRVFDWDGKNRFEIQSDYPLKRIAVDANGMFYMEYPKITMMIPLLFILI